MLKKGLYLILLVSQTAFAEVESIYINSEPIPTDNRYPYYSSIDSSPDLSVKEVNGLTTIKAEGMRSYDTRIFIGPFQLKDKTDINYSSNSLVDTAPWLGSDIKVSGRNILITPPKGYSEREYATPHKLITQRTLNQDGFWATQVHTMYWNKHKPDEDKKSDVLMNMVGWERELHMGWLNVTPSLYRLEVDRVYPYGEYQADVGYKKLTLESHGFGWTWEKQQTVFYKSDILSVRYSKMEREIHANLYGFFITDGQYIRKASPYERGAELDFGGWKWMMGNENLSPEKICRLEVGYGTRVGEIDFKGSIASTTTGNQIVFDNSTWTYGNTENRYKVKTYKTSAEWKGINIERFMYSRDGVLDIPTQKTILWYQTKLGKIGMLSTGSQMTVDENSECLDTSLKIVRKKATVDIFYELNSLPVNVRVQNGQNRFEIQLLIKGKF